MSTKFNTTEELIADIRAGKMVILVDDEDRENEGDLVLAAEHVTPALINFMALHARGLICLSLTSQQVERLGIPLMVREDQNLTPNKTAFTVSIEASQGVSTGISAADRAHTIKVAANPQAKAGDIHTPGHIFPIRAQHGGVLRRAGHTEGSIDLAVLAGLNPAAVICEVMNDDGTMARVPDLVQFAKKHGIKIGTIVDLIEYRLSRDVLVEEICNQELPPEYGSYRARVFLSKVDGMEHLVLQKGEISPDEPTLVRVHLDHYSKEVFGKLKYDQSSLESAIEKLNESDEASVFLLIRGNNKPHGLVTEIQHICGQSQARLDMDTREYGVGAQILRALGIHKIKLLSQKVDKRVGLKAFGIEIVEVTAMSEDELAVIDCKESEQSDEEAKEDNSSKEIKNSKENKNRNRNVTIQ